MTLDVFEGGGVGFTGLKIRDHLDTHDQTEPTDLAELAGRRFVIRLKGFLIVKLEGYEK